MLNIRSQKDPTKNQHYFCYLVYKGVKNYEALCFNTVLNILMIIQDSKFSMAELDI